jgi:DNA invertase Pin-like site-specific DNA recombinase
VASGQRVGYIRVSSLGQNPVRQLEGVEADTVFTDTVSGKRGTAKISTKPAVGSVSPGQRECL